MPVKPNDLFAIVVVIWLEEMKTVVTMTMKIDIDNIDKIVEYLMKHQTH